MNESDIDRSTILFGRGGQGIEFYDIGSQKMMVSMTPVFANSLRRIAYEEGGTIAFIVRQALAWYCVADNHLESIIPYNIGLSDKADAMVRLTILLSTAQLQEVDGFIKFKAIENPRWKTISRAAVIRMSLLWREYYVRRMVRNADKGHHRNYEMRSLWRPTFNHRRED